MLWKTPLRVSDKLFEQVSPRVVEHQKRKELGDLVKRLDTVMNTQISILRLSVSLSFFFSYISTNYCSLSYRKRGQSLQLSDRPKSARI